MTVKILKHPLSFQICQTSEAPVLSGCLEKDCDAVCTQVDMHHSEVKVITLFPF